VGRSGEDPWDVVAEPRAGIDREPSAISCSSPGNCSTGGLYTDADHHFQAWIDTQSAGTWGKAIEVPGTGTLNFYNADVEAISCASNGACGAAGYFIALGDAQQPFVDTLGSFGPLTAVTKVTPAAGPTGGARWSSWSSSVRRRRLGSSPSPPAQSG
jgi:hypothetical protein